VHHHWRARGVRMTPMPMAARLILLLLFLALAVTFGRPALHFLLHPFQHPPAVHAASVKAAPGSSPAFQPIPWQRDVMMSLESAIDDAQRNNLTAAEVDVDRASSLVEAARLQSNAAAPDFFSTAIQQLDRVAAVRPDDGRLVEHARIVRIDLAELRSALAGPVTASPVALAVSTGAHQASPASGSSANRRIMFDAPRSIAANQDVTPASLGGDYVDASLMPDVAEMLEPPATRLFVDNVRVENVTFAGAAQTLDGIHWHNVVFIGTRLRYEGGEVDLQNVRFVRCTFGFSTDDRGARLANAIALGQTSLVIE